MTSHMRTIGSIALLSMALMLYGPPLEEAGPATSLQEGARRQPPVATRDTPTNSATGTIKAIDVEERTVDVIAGVGHALRLVRMPVSPDCYVGVAGAAARRFDDLRRGDVIRVDYREAPQGPVAERIEIIREASQGGRR